MTTDKIDTNNNSPSPPNFSLTLFEEFYERVKNTQYKNDTYCKGESPLFYKECGFTQHLNISFNKSHLAEHFGQYRADKVNPYKNTQEEIEKHIISHTLPDKFWIRFEELLKDPIAVIPSNPNKNGNRSKKFYLAILDYAVEYKDRYGFHKDYVAVAFKDGINRIEGLEHPAMEIKSVYAKSFVPTIIQKTIVESKLFESDDKKYYINIKKVEKLLTDYSEKLSKKGKFINGLDRKELDNIRIVTEKFLDIKKSSELLLKDSSLSRAHNSLDDYMYNILPKYNFVNKINKKNEIFIFHGGIYNKNNISQLIETQQDNTTNNNLQNIKTENIINDNLTIIKDKNIKNENLESLKNKYFKIGEKIMERKENFKIEEKTRTIILPLKEANTVEDLDYFEKMEKISDFFKREDIKKYFTVVSFFEDSYITLSTTDSISDYISKNSEYLTIPKTPYELIKSLDNLLYQNEETNEYEEDDYDYVEFKKEDPRYSSYEVDRVDKYLTIKTQRGKLTESDKVYLRAYFKRVDVDKYAVHVATNSQQSEVGIYVRSSLLLEPLELNKENFLNSKTVEEFVKKFDEILYPGQPLQIEISDDGQVKMGYFNKALNEKEKQESISDDKDITLLYNNKVVNNKIQDSEEFFYGNNDEFVGIERYDKGQRDDKTELDRQNRTDDTRDNGNVQTRNTESEISSNTTGIQDIPEQLSVGRTGRADNNTILSREGRTEADISSDRTTRYDQLERDTINEERYSDDVHITEDVSKTNSINDSSTNWRIGNDNFSGGRYKWSGAISSSQSENGGWDKRRRILSQYSPSIIRNIAEDRDDYLTKTQIKERREKVKEILNNKTDDQINENDKLVLSKYEGAGGLGEEAENGTHEFLSEYYTPKRIIDFTWAVVDRYIAEGYTRDVKEVLEPSCGIGRFAKNRNEHFYMYEVDPNSSRIAKLLYPNNTVINEPFQKHYFDGHNRKSEYSAEDCNSYHKDIDLVIGNPPYGDYRGSYKGLGEGENCKTYPEYFITRSLDELKNGGLLAFVVPAGFLNSNENSKAKEYIAKYSELVNAYRLPSNIFNTTDITTDVIFLRSNKAKDENEIKERLENISNDNFFKNHTDHIFGVQYLGNRNMVKVDFNTRYSWDKKVVIGNSSPKYNDIDGYIEEELTKLYKEDVNDDILYPCGKKELNFSDEEREKQKQENSQKVIDEYEKNKVKEQKKPKKAKEYKFAEIKKEELQSEEEFNTKYKKEYSKEYKEIWKEVKYDGTFSLHNSNLTDKAKELLKNNKEFVLINEQNQTYMPYVLFTSGNIYQKIEDLRKDIQNNYISQETFNRLFSILENAKPKKITFENILLKPNTTLAEEFKVKRVFSVYNYRYGLYEEEEREINLKDDFLFWANGEDRNNISGTHPSSYLDESVSRVKSNDFGRNINFSDICEYLEGKSVRKESLSYWEKNGKTEEEIERMEEALKQKAELKKAERMEGANKLFLRYLNDKTWITEEERERITEKYNEYHNAVVLPDFNKIPIFLDGMNKFKNGREFTLHDAQLRGINFLTQKGKGLLAYDVGLGKTSAGICATVLQLQSGRAKKPLIIVPKAVYPKWVNDIHEHFPNIKINALGNMNYESTLSYRNEDDWNKLDIDEGSITVITYEALQGNLTFDEKTLVDLSEEYEYIYGDHSGNRRKDAAIEEKIDEFISKKFGSVSDNAVYFNLCEFDHITVDEAHNFKNLVTTPSTSNKYKAVEYGGIKGGKPSARAKNLFAITQYVQKNNNDRNVFFLTATPFTNSPLEVYSMLTYLYRKELLNSHLYNIRDFIEMFVNVKYELVIEPKGNIKNGMVVKDWSNLKSLQNILQNCMDKITADDAGIQRPERMVEKILVEPSELQKEIFELEKDRMLSSKKNTGEVLLAISNSRIATLSPVLLNANRIYDKDAEIPDKRELVSSSPKLKITCETVAKNWKAHKDCGQVIYMTYGTDYFPLLKEILTSDYGIDKNAIEIIDGKTKEDKRTTIQEKFNDPKNPVKILIGGEAITEGVDLNGNSTTLYNLNLGWNPTELTQSEGRIHRQGNRQGIIHIVYVLENDTSDPVILQKLDEKKSRIDEIWNYNSKENTIDVSDINPLDTKFDLINDPEKIADIKINEKITIIQSERKVIENDQNRLYRVYNELLNTKNLIEVYSKASDNNKGYKSAISKQNRLYKILKDEFNLSVDEINDEKIESIKKEQQERINEINTRIENVHSLRPQMIAEEKQAKEEKMREKFESKEYYRTSDDVFNQINNNLKQADWVKEQEQTPIEEIKEETETIENTKTTETEIINLSNSQNINNVNSINDNLQDIKTENNKNKVFEKPISKKGKIDDSNFGQMTLFADMDENFLITEYGYYGLQSIGEILYNRLTDAGVNVKILDNELKEKLEEEIKEVAGENALSNKHIYGYTNNDGIIYINKVGFSPNTLLHEYTHLWTQVIKQTNPLMWEKIKKELLNDPLFEKLKNDDVYKKTIQSSDALVSEILAIKSSQRAEEILEENHRYFNETGTQVTIDGFWNEVSKTLSPYNENKYSLSTSDIVNSVVNDVFKNPNFKEISKRYNYYSDIIEEDVDLTTGYMNLNKELVQQLEHLRPNMSESLKAHYNEFVQTAKDPYACANTLLRAVEEEAVANRFFTYYIREGADERVKEYLNSVLEENVQEEFSNAFENGYHLRVVDGIEDNGTDSRLLNFACFLHREIFIKKNDFAENILKDYLQKENSKELVRVMMLLCPVSTEVDFVKRSKINSLLPTVSVISEDNKVRYKQQTFDIVNENLIVTSNKYNTIYENVDTLKKSNLSFKNKLLSLTDDFKQTQSQDAFKKLLITDKPLEVSYKDKLGLLQTFKLQRAYKENNTHKIDSIEKEILEKTVLKETELKKGSKFYLTDLDCFYSKKDDKLTVPFSVAINIHEILKNSRVVSKEKKQNDVVDVNLALIRDEGKDYYIEIKTKYEDKVKKIVNGGITVLTKEEWEEKIYSKINQIDKNKKEQQKKEVTEEDIKEYFKAKNPYKYLKYEYEKERAMLEEENKRKFEKDFLSFTTVEKKPEVKKTEKKQYMVQNTHNKKYEQKRISKEKIEEIKNSIKLSDVVRMYTDITTKGNKMFCVCPFHADKNPSMHISDEKGVYHCFGCGEKGSMFDFVSKIENISFVEAVKKIAEYARVDLNEDAVRKVKTPHPQQNTFKQEEVKKETTQEDKSKALERAKYLFEKKAQNTFIPNTFKYLTEHNIDPFTLLKEKTGCDVRFNREFNNLLIPQYSNTTGKFCNFQLIKENGDKKNVYGCEIGHTLIKGADKEKNKKVCFVVEGWADAVVLARETKIDTYCSFGSNNLKECVDYVKKNREENCAVIVVADHDKPLQGKTVGIGEEKARSTNANLVVVMEKEGEDICEYSKFKDIDKFLRIKIKEEVIKKQQERQIIKNTEITPKSVISTTFSNDYNYNNNYNSNKMQRMSI